MKMKTSSKRLQVYKCMQVVQEAEKMCATCGV